MDVSFVASVNVRYWSSQIDAEIYVIDKDAGDVYKIGISSARRAQKRVWLDYSADIFEQCWDHTELIPPTNYVAAS